MSSTESETEGRGFFMGLDASTQSLKASLLDESLRVVGELGVNFDADLSHATQSGALHGPGGQVFSPVLLLTDALELLFAKLKQAEWPLAQVKAISASGQQHATTYWSHQSSDLLSTLPKDGISLSTHLQPAFSRSIIPNWQDSSTAAECQQLEAAVGGPAALARLTGSSSHTRFSASQIMRFRQQEPEAWHNTARISLCSSALTTLLCLDGEVKGIDESDAGGMNLWDMSSQPRTWNSTLLGTVAGSQAEAKRLEAMLGTVEMDAGRVVGKIGAWFNLHFGMNAHCLVTTGTGDNLATFLSFVLPERHAVLSMGTSDTLLLSSSSYVPDEAHHVFVHPAQRGPANGEETRYMSMLCFKNGSLAREAVRDAFEERTWDAFNAGVLQGKGLPTHARFSWLLPEIIPKDAHGTARYSRADGASNAWELQQQPFDAPTEALALLEAQFMSYRVRLGRILSSAGTSSTGPDTRQLQAVYAVGGAAQNPTICKVAADVLNADVLRPAPSAAPGHASGNWTQEVASPNACSLGAAFKAFWSFARHTAKDEQSANVSFDDCIRAARSSAQSAGFAAVKPDVARSRAYEDAGGWWSQLEERAISEAK